MCTNYSPVSYTIGQSTVVITHGGGIYLYAVYYIDIENR